jgi:hypothetical protein
MNTIAINFVAPPMLIVSNVSVCPGTAAVFSALGANSYTWNPSNTNGNTFSVIPTANTIYTVSGDNSGCIATLTVSAFIYSPPGVSLTCNSPICEGQTILLNGNNGSTYLWTGPQGYQSTQQYPSIVNASVNNSGNYTYSVTDNHGCSAFASVLFVVYSNPTISVSGNLSICQGQSTTLQASGANNYNWNVGSTSASITISPYTNTSYTVSGLGNNYCTGFATVAITVNPNPTVSILGNTLTCSGQNVILMANGASTYSWNTGSTNFSVTVNPTITATYTVIGFQALTACADTKTISVKVSNCMGINNWLNEDRMIKLFPNPNDGNFNIEAGCETHILIFNPLGQLIFETNIESGFQPIRLLNVSKGIYLFKALNLQGNFNGKILVE